MKMYYESDVNTDALEGKTVAVMGYGSQGRAQSRNMADSGVNVIVGLRENGNSWNLAKEDGMTVKTFSDAAKEADIIHILLPEKHFHLPVFCRYWNDEKMGSFLLHCLKVLFQFFDTHNDLDCASVFLSFR